jgi:hypothetical protein
VARFREEKRSYDAITELADAGVCAGALQLHARPGAGRALLFLNTACISSTASTVSIMRKAASWIALDWPRPVHCRQGGDIRCVPANWHHRGPRALASAPLSEAVGRQGCHVVPLD